MTRTEPDTGDAKETRRLLVAIAALTGVAASIVFVGWP
jgi:hypothetical protein